MGRLSDFATAASRSRLKPLAGCRPHWRFLAKRKALGYRPKQGGGGAGTWCVRVLMPGTQIYRQGKLGNADDDRLIADGRSVLNLDQAVEAALAWCEDIERGAKGLAPVKRGPYTVNHCMDDYLEWFKHHRKSWRQTAATAKAHIRPALGKLDITELTSEALRLWHHRLAEVPARRRTKPLAPQNYDSSEHADIARRRKVSANRVLAVLRAALNFAFSNGHAKTDVAWRRLRPFRNVERPRLVYLTVPEARRLLAACEPDFARLVRGALTTGARYGELVSLKVSDFRASPVPCLLIQDSKSGKQRAIYLNDEGVSFFADLCGRRPVWELIFLRSDGTPWQRAQQGRRMADACRRAGIDRPVSFHALRHTYASLYLMNGGQLPDLAAQLGHADTRMTIRHYAHLADSWRAESARKFAPTFGAVDASGVLRFRPRDGGGDHAGHL